MTFQELQTALAIPSDKVLKISKGMLGDDVDRLIDDVFAGQPITLNAAKPGTGNGQNQTVVIEGTAALLKSGDVTVTARIREVAGAVEMILSYPLSEAGVDAWSFSTSFPDLPGVVDWSKPSTDPATIPLDALDLSAPRFVLSATATTDPDTAVTLMPGINFTATLTPSLVLVAVKELFGQSGRMTLFGTIRPDDTGTAPDALEQGQYPWSDGVTVPGISLCADMTGGGAKFGGMVFDGVQFRIYSPLSQTWAAQNTDYAPMLAYSGAMAVPSAALNIRMTTPIALGASDFRLTVDTDGFSLQNLTSLAALSDLAGTADLVSALPDKVAEAGDALGQLQLEFAAVSLSIAHGKVSLDAVDVTIGMPDVNWDVLPGHFKVVNFQASFGVEDPLDAKTRKFETLVRGQIEIEGIPIDIRAHKAEDFTLFAELGAQQTIPLNTLLGTYIKDAEAPGDLTIDALSVEVTPGTSFGMALALAGQPTPWEIPIATKTLVVSDVSAALNYTAAHDGKDSETTGSFAGTISMGQASLFVGYDVPGPLVIKADLPDINLTALALEIGNISDLPMPPNFPEVALKHSKVIFETDKTAGTRIYDFSLRTMVEIGGIERLNLGAVALRGKTASGMAVAIWTPKWEDGQGWSPGSLWAPLSALEITSMGLVLSSIKAEQAQKAKIVSTRDVPAVAVEKFEIVQGVTFFASLGLQTGQVAVLKEIFGAHTRFDLYASYDTIAKKTALIAHLGGSPAKGAFQFKGFDLSWNSTGTSDVTISARAAGALHIDSETLTFVVTGKISSSGAARLELAVEDWAHPFGYQRLTVKQFGVAIAMDSGVIITANGTFSFTPPGKSPFTFGIAGAIIDFEAPSALAFKLQSDNDELLTLGEVLAGITTIDIYSLPPGAEVAIPWVGQVKLLDLFLKFRQIGFWAVVADEVQIKDVVYRKGFGFKGDITLFDKPITAFLDVKEAEKQFAGGAEMPQEVTIGSVLKLGRPKTPEMTPSLNLTRGDGTQVPGKGPIMAISSQIDADHAHYIYVAAHLEFMGIVSADLYGEASDDGVKYYYRLAAGTSGQGAWGEQEITLLVSRADLAVATSINYDFGLKDVTLGGFDLFGFIPIPELDLPDFEIGIGANIGAGLSPPQFHLGGHLKFKFMGIDFHPEFQIDLVLDNAPKQIAEFAGLVWDWIKQNIAKLMEAIWDTAEAFVDWIKERWKDFKDMANQVAQVLFHAFGIEDSDATRALLQTIGYAEHLIDTAIQVMDEACSMTRAALAL